jgi:hypothetical protein
MRQFYKFGDSQIIKDVQKYREAGKKVTCYYVMEVGDEK